MIAAFVIILTLSGDAPEPEPGVVYEEIRLDWPCQDEAPRTPLEQPRCSDYDLHTAWIEAADRGDLSVIPVLRDGYATANSTEEKNRIAAALLRRVPDDRAIWKELLSHAQVVIRFPRVQREHSEAFLRWCGERAFDPETYWYIALRALEAAGHDPRSHALLLTALKSDDEDVVMMAVQGLGTQHDETSLPLIEEAIRRFPNDPAAVAFPLVAFGCERADALAAQYLSDEELAVYMDQRLGIEPEP